MDKHVSVLLEETIEGLNIKSDGIYIDCTLGYGGHSKKILEKLSTGHLYGFDQDLNAISASSELLKKVSNNYTLIHSNFRNLKEKLSEQGIDKVDGIIFDLGVSSPQIDEASRGFSYMKDARLDMRMDQDGKLSAYEVVNNYSEDELVRIFRLYGEEKHARRIAKNIILNRNIEPINTTLELVKIIDEVIPYRDKRHTHPAKKVFQAIRIEVNKELDVLQDALYQSLELLNIEGRLCVITFHSLEDRICKKIFNEVSKEDPLIKGMPNMDKDLLPDFKVITNNAIKPTITEINNNSRSASALLRIIERIK